MSEQLFGNLPKSRDGKHRRIIIGIRDRNQPGAVVWLLQAGETLPHVEGLGLNPELEQKLIGNARLLSETGNPVPFYPHPNSTETEPGLSAYHYPAGVTAAFLAALPGRAELLRIEPEEDYSLLPLMKDTTVEDYADEQDSIDSIERNK